jgi:hypothetical protein
MKKLVTLLFVCLLITTAYAQRTTAKKAKIARSSSSTPVEAAQVPQAVQDSHNQSFSGTTLSRWELKQATGKKEVQWYTAVFNTTESTKARARYKVDGTLISSTSYFGPEKTPEAIKAAAATRFSGYNLVGCSKINSAKKNKNYYLVRLKKGTTKITTLMDESGNEIGKDSFRIEEKEELGLEEDGEGQ